MTYLVFIREVVEGDDGYELSVTKPHHRFSQEALTYVAFNYPSCGGVSCLGLTFWVKIRKLS